MCIRDSHKGHIPDGNAVELSGTKDGSINSVNKVQPEVLGVTPIVPLGASHGLYPFQVLRVEEAGVRRRAPQYFMSCVVAFESREERGRARGVVRHEGGLITVPRGGRVACGSRCRVTCDAFALVHGSDIVQTRIHYGNIRLPKSFQEGWPVLWVELQVARLQRRCRKWRRFSKKPAESDADALIHRLPDVLVQAQVRRARRERLERVVKPLTHGVTNHEESSPPEPRPERRR